MINKRLEAELKDLERAINPDLNYLTPITKGQRLANIILRAANHYFPLDRYLNVDVDYMLADAIKHLYEYTNHDAVDLQLNISEDGLQHFVYEDGHGYKVEETGLFLDFKTCKVGESVRYYWFVNSRGHVISLWHKVKRKDKAKKK